VFAALAGADVAVIAAEPTMSGIHDMERILQVARHFGIPAAVVINKYDLNQDNTRAIQGYCERENLPVAGRIPFSHTVTESVVRGVPLVEHDPGGAGKLLEEIWIKVTEDGADQ
jgi:MinD superfamily P-loop ATPase